jgi:predicted metal-dependent hydrolase
MVNQLRLGEIAVDVVLKDIKNVHLSVYPPTGRVRISAPHRMKLCTICLFAISKLSWIKQQQSSRRSCANKNAKRRASTWTARATTCGESAAC